MPSIKDNGRRRLPNQFVVQVALGENGLYVVTGDGRLLRRHVWRGSEPAKGGYPGERDPVTEVRWEEIKIPK